MEYMVELHNVPHEIPTYISELMLYGDITYQVERYPVYVWMESMWDLDILSSSLGVKKVHQKRKEPDEPAWLR
ncbi:MULTISPECIES: hypothetical protein [Paenibacillus]|uniref:hypothetical protein n=1 Tax=Paenibacillus TaxID=44249 RepID=UPI000F51C04C|nr:hypothetical protein [Paenibacillus xylanexedens]RPK20101.1 hypothetical protein EDO6_06640 [Paenibacillus xylanexedens]